MSLPEKATERLYGELKEIVGERTVDRENIVEIALALMKLVEHYPDLKGPQKKQLIIHVLNTFIADTVADPTEAELIEGIVKFTLPALIDTVVSIDKKEVQVKVRKGIRKLLSCCGCD